MQAVFCRCGAHWHGSFVNSPEIQKHDLGTPVHDLITPEAFYSLYPRKRPKKQTLDVRVQVLSAALGYAMRLLKQYAPKGFERSQPFSELTAAYDGTDD